MSSSREEIVESFARSVRDRGVHPGRCGHERERRRAQDFAHSRHRGGDSCETLVKLDYMQASNGRYVLSARVLALSPAYRRRRTSKPSSCRSCVVLRSSSRTALE